MDVLHRFFAFDQDRVQLVTSHHGLVLNKLDILSFFFMAAISLLRRWLTQKHESNLISTRPGLCLSLNPSLSGMPS
jgi:hypothetical protein